MATGNAAATRRATGIWSLWRNRNYLLLWSGQAVSVVGTQLSQLAFPLLVLALTGSAAQAGFLGAARTIPYMLLGLPAGALVDRWGRKRLMMVCDAGRALLLASIPLALALGRLSLAQLYAVALAEGTLNVFFSLANTAGLVRVVSKEQLPVALAADEVTQSSGYAVGPALGGVLFGLGRALPFLGDAISYAISVATLGLISVKLNEERTAERGSLRAEIGEGLQWLWRQPLLRFLAALVGGGLLVESGYLLVVIVLVQRMGGSDAAVGLVLGVGGVGSVIGGLAAAPMVRRFTFGQITLAVHWLWALTVLLYAVAPTPAAVALITAVAFGTSPIFLVAQFSYRLSLIPDALQGRVNSVFRLVLYTCQPLGLALTGVLIQRFGPIPAVLVLAAILAAFSLAATLYAPMRSAPKLAETAA
jgi:MFS family permease